jgi:hypothetical protein
MVFFRSGHIFLEIELVMIGHHLHGNCHNIPLNDDKGHLT